jgi:hypothetical protein
VRTVRVVVEWTDLLKKPKSQYSQAKVKSFWTNAVFSNNGKREIEVLVEKLT